MSPSRIYPNFITRRPYTWGGDPASPGTTVTFPTYSSEDANVNNIKVDVIEARDGAAAQALLHFGLKSYTATGASKRNKGEPFVSGVGGRLAIARALRNLARELEKGIN